MNESDLDKWLKNGDMAKNNPDMIGGKSLPPQKIKMKRRSKYGNRRVSHDGYTFDSKAERKRYDQLRLLQMAREITGLIVHPRYTILDKFTDVHGLSHREVKYIGDFEYVTSEGERICEDVKGVETAIFKLKRKLFCFRYPETRLVIVKVK